jgi:putative N6-adenine-specific DNA methylase
LQKEILKLNTQEKTKVTSTIVVTTPKGLSSVLKDEIGALGFTAVHVGTMSVTVMGSFSDAIKLNLYLRTAHHVLYKIDEFRCTSPDDLYKNVNRLPWETMIAADEYLSVVSNVENDTIRDSRFANMKCKDAIVDRILSRKGKRPDSGPERNGVVVNIYWKNEKCIVYIDTSGESLSRRGYRMIPLHAPMQETLAAGIILSGRKLAPDMNFVNPMCGSGTIAIEAALLQANIAPGLLRNNFGFLHTLLCNKNEWAELRACARAAVKRQEEKKIIASDIDPEAIRAAQKNAQTAGVLDMIEFSEKDISDSVVPNGSGVVMINPEYGIRLGDEKTLEDTYRKIGWFLKNRCAGYVGYVFTGNTKLIGNVGLKSKRRIPFNSGTLECRLYEYELYEGKREDR